MLEVDKKTFEDEVLKAEGYVFVDFFGDRHIYKDGKSFSGAVKYKINGSADTKDTADQCGKCAKVNGTHQCRIDTACSSKWNTGRLVQKEGQAKYFFPFPEDIKEKEECNNDHAKSEYTENQACEKFLQFSSHGWQASFSEDS